MHVKMNSSTFDVSQITFPDTILNQDFAEMRGKHLALSRRIVFVKIDSRFTEICAKYFPTLVTAVFPRSAFVVLG